MQSKLFERKENRKLRHRRNISYSYLLMIILGAFLLFLPITSKDGYNVSFIDAFFVSASAFSDTGLSPIVTADAFNNLGQLIIITLIAFGGIGLMSVKVGLFIIVGKKINTTDRMLIFTEQNQTKSGGMVKLIIDSLKVVIAFTLIFALIIAIHVMVNYDYNLPSSLWFGLFHSISSINNAGFDLTGQSLIPFAEDYLFQTYTMILIIVGGVGFPVLVDIKNSIKAHKKGTPYRFSLFTKISLITYFAISIVGFILIMICDSHFIFVENTGPKGIFYALFQVISARNAGFATVSLTNFSESSQIVLAILMFIGAAPASTGGGIRTTTFAVVLLFLKSFANNRAEVTVFNRRIPRATIFNTFVTFTVAIFLCFIATFLVITLDVRSDLLAVIFEVCSAFGTTGLTLDYTPYLNWLSKIVIASMMIIGQIGIANVMIIFSKNHEKKDQIRVPEEDITIG